MSAVLEILAAGPLTAVQDTGRNGVRALGIGTAGSMDVFAARVANALLGNPDAAPVLELSAGGVEMRALRGAVFALCGADFGATLDGIELPLCAPFVLGAGQALSLPRARRGLRACLAVRGGFAADRVFGSSATDLRGGFGGYGGRALRRGDCLQLAAPATDASVPRAVCTALAHPGHRDEQALQLVAGPALAQLADDDRARLGAEAFTVAREADRMGLRLEEALPSAAQLPRPLSAAVCFGAMQLPPDGRAILLGADCQTTGGYPVLGVVASVDHWRIAQARPGDRLRLRVIDVVQAQHAWRLRERALARLRIAAAAAWSSC